MTNRPIERIANLQRRRLLAAFPLTIFGAGSPAQISRSAPKRVGMLHQGTRVNETEPLETAFVEAMKPLNWVLGRDFLIIRGYGDWRVERIGAVVADLIRQKVDIIILYTSDDFTVAVAQATATVPIVFSEAYAPLELGLIDSYARPGRNLTGTTIFSGPEFIVKRLEFLRALVPTATRLFWLYGSGSTFQQTLSGASFDSGKLIERAADSLGMLARIHVVHQPSDVEGALAAAEAWRAHAISAGGSPVFREKQQIINFAAKARLPTVFSVRNYVDAGGLLSYGVPTAEYEAMKDRWVRQIDKVLRGAPTATMPVEIPRRFELCLNVKTAKSLGIDIPISLLSRADEIINN